jgi:hypothetical protein
MGRYVKNGDLVVLVPSNDIISLHGSEAPQSHHSLKKDEVCHVFRCQLQTGEGLNRNIRVGKKMQRKMGGFLSDVKVRVCAGER